MSSRLKLAGICFAAAFVLAACGGGGSPLDAARAERDQLAEQLRQAREDLSTAQDQVMSLMGQVSNLSGELSVAEVARNAAQQQVTDLTTQLSTANDDLETAQTNLQNALAQGIDDQTEINQLTEAVAAAEEMRNNVENQLGTANTNLATANTRVTELESQLATANAALAAANRLTGLFESAQNTNSDAVAAGKAAAAALMSATENAAKLSTMEVAGDSTVAMTAAQAILQARDDAAQAVTDAEAALAAANEAKTHAENIAADHPQKASLDAAIEAAIEAAEAQIEAAKASRDDQALADAVAEVTGGEDADPQGTPRSIANKVGMDIAMALLPTSSTDGGGMRHTHGTTAPAGTIADALKVEGHDRVGLTWAERVGNTQKMRIATSSTNTNEVDASSIAGMILVSAATVTDRATDADAVEVNGSQVAATYKGIAGTAFCVGTDCVVEEVPDENDNRKFTGSWYFTPASPMQAYVETADGTFEPETLFATFGHWLTVNDQGNTDPTDDEWTVNTFATSTITERGDLTTVNPTGDTLTDSSATYSGTAAGMSVHKTDNAAGDGQDINSGRFTATVSLTATFGAAPMLSGVVSGFEGSAVNTNWRVTLSEKEFTANFTDGAAVATGRDGEWTANAYGVANQRPTGIYGGFNAHFSDGHAAGAYATRRED